MAGAVKLTGLRPLIRACNKGQADLRKGLRAELKAAADIVRQDARRRFTRIDVRSAEGFRPRARASGAVVEQSRRRVTGRRPDFGALQMRDALVPALESKRDEVIEHVDGMLDRLARDW